MFKAPGSLQVAFCGFRGVTCAGVLLDDDVAFELVIDEHVHNIRNASSSLTERTEDDVSKGVLETPVTTARLVQNLSVDILEVKQADGIEMFGNEPIGITAAEGEVTGVEAEVHPGRVKNRQQVIDFLWRLNVRTYVIVIPEMQIESGSDIGQPDEIVRKRAVSRSGKRERTVGWNAPA